MKQQNSKRSRNDHEEIKRAVSFLRQNDSWNHMTRIELKVSVKNFRIARDRWIRGINRKIADSARNMRYSISARVRIQIDNLITKHYDMAYKIDATKKYDFYTTHIVQWIDNLRTDIKKSMESCSQNALRRNATSLRRIAKKIGEMADIAPSVTPNVQDVALLSEAFFRNRNNRSA